MHNIKNVSLLKYSQLTLLSVGGGGNTARSFGLNLRLFTLVFLNFGKKRSQDSLASDGSFISSCFIIKIYGGRYINNVECFNRYKP